jgi:predicted nucleic acid-binding protein
VSQVLVDTSVWRRYLSGRTSPADTANLAALLDEDGALLCHVAVVGELVLGGLSRADEERFLWLPRAPEVAASELLEFIRRLRLARRGIGWADAQLLASARVAGCALWTFDRSLDALAAELGVRFDGRGAVAQRD